jgi:hypothetical protein
VVSSIPGRSLTAFKNTYDKSIVVPAKIEAALARISTEYRTSLEFQKEADVSMTELAAFRDQYEDYIVVVKTKDSKPKDIWFGSTELAAEARESVR